jgi:hypothetical protein
MHVQFVMGIIFVNAEVELVIMNSTTEAGRRVLAPPTDRPTVVGDGGFDDAREVDSWARQLCQGLIILMASNCV